MKLQVYETSALKPYRTQYEATQKQLKQYYEMNAFADVAVADWATGKFQEGSFFFNSENDKGQRTSVRVIPYMENLSGMPGFKHPIILETLDLAVPVVFNAGAYGNLDNNGTINIRQSSKHAFNFMVSYSYLIGLRYFGLSSTNILALGHILSNTASLCLSHALAQRFSLDYATQINIQALCAYFYHRAGLDCSPEQSCELSSIATKIDISIIRGLCLDTVAQEMTCIPDLANAISELSGSERMVGINSTIIYTMLKRYWISDNGAELICIAYEMPHIWALLCYSAIYHATYKRNPLSDILKISSKHYDVKLLEVGMRRILENKE